MKKKYLILLIILFFPAGIYADVLLEGKFKIYKGTDFLGEEIYKVMTAEGNTIVGSSSFYSKEQIDKKNKKLPAVRSHISLSAKNELIKYKKWWQKQNREIYFIAFAYDNKLKTRLEEKTEPQIKEFGSISNVAVLDNDIFFLVPLLLHISQNSQSLPEVFFPVEGKRIKFTKATKSAADQSGNPLQTIEIICDSCAIKAVSDQKGKLLDVTIGELKAVSQ
jgi:hypothetical protein